MAESLKVVPISSVEWAHHVAVSVERLLRDEKDPKERERLRALRDWHYASLSEDQIGR